MLYSFHQKRQETLAEYFYRTNRHLPGGIKVAEYGPERDDLRIIGFDVNRDLWGHKNEEICDAYHYAGCI